MWELRSFYLLDQISSLIGPCWSDLSRPSHFFFSSAFEIDTCYFKIYWTFPPVKYYLIFYKIASNHQFMNVSSSWAKLYFLVGKRFKFIKRLLDDWITQNHLYQLNKRRVIIRRNKGILPHYCWLLDSWIHFGLTSINFKVLNHFFNFVPLIGTRRFWMLSNMNHTADNG